MENTTKTVFSMDGVDYTRTVVTDESGKKILDCTENNTLSLEGDTTIHATKVDEVVTRVDETPSKGIVKDLDCYGGLLAYVDRQNEIAKQKPPMTSEEIRKCLMHSYKPRPFTIYTSAEGLKQWEEVLKNIKR